MHAKIWEIKFPGQDDGVRDRGLDEELVQGTHKDGFRRFAGDLWLGILEGQ